MQNELDISDPSPSPAPEPPSPTFSERLQVWAVWALLLLAALGIFAFTVSSPQSEPSERPAVSAELQFQGKYAVGVSTLLGRLGEGFAGNLDGQLLDQLRQLADTPAEELCVVPLVAELKDVEAALEEIARQRRKESLPDDVAGDLELLERLYRQPASVDEEERSAFLERRKWFARLALSQGEAGDDGKRRAVVGQSTRVALLMFSLVAGVGLGTLVGCGLLVVALVGAARGRWVRHYEPRQEPMAAIRRLPYVEALLVFVLAMVFIVPLAFQLVSGWTDSSEVPLALTLLTAPAVLWPLARRLSWSDVRQAYGWHRGQGVWREIGCGLLGYVAGAPLLALGVLVSLVLSLLVEKKPHHPLMDSVPGSGLGGVLLIYLVACVSAPLLEETLFRGGLYHALRGRWGAVASALLVSLIFAGIHPQGILGLPPLIALAMILASIREWRGSLIGPIAVHAVHNGLATTVLLLLFR